MPRWFLSVLVTLAALFGVVSIASAAPSGPLTCPPAGGVVTGAITSGDPAQTGRFTRASNPASTCASPKAGSPAQDSGHYAYDQYTFKNRTASSQCMSITLESTSGTPLLQSAAYSGTYNPNDITQGYLGDSGPSIGGSSPSSVNYEVTVASLADFVVVVTESQDGAGGAYKVTVQNCGEVLVSAVVPSFGPTSGQTPVTIQGAGFVSPTTVTFGGTASSGSCSVTDEFTMTCTTPAHAAGAVDVVATIPSTASSTLSNGFTYYDDITTSTTLQSSVNPSVFGQTVTLTAHVAPTSPAPFNPFGQVTFKDGGSPIGTAQLDGAGNATIDVSDFSVGTHSLTVDYAGVGGTVGGIVFLSSSSSTLDQVVNKADTVTGVASSANPAGVGANVMFTATVTASAPGAGTPTGTVHFLDNGTEIGTGTLSGGQATFSTTSLGVGSHPITAVYDGDGNFNGSSTSSALSQVIDANATTVSISPSPASPSTFGTSVTFTVTVSGGASTPTGNVTFKDGSTVIGTTQVLDGAGQAQVSISTLSAGVHTISAAYEGDGTHQAGTGSISYTVNAAATSVALASSANPSAPGQSVMFTATVTSAVSGTITGTVTFKDNTSTLGTGSVTSGQATFSTTTLAVGTHPITAVYGGAGNYAAATSSTLNQVVAVLDGGVDGGKDGGADAGRDSGTDSGVVDSGTELDSGAVADSGVSHTDGGHDDGGVIAGGGGSDSGCGCTTAGAPASTALSGLAWVAIGLLVARRRRRS